MLGLDLVVRDKNGSILDPDVTGVIELYRRVCFLHELQQKYSVCVLFSDDFVSIFQHDSTQTRISNEVKSAKNIFALEQEFFANALSPPVSGCDILLNITAPFRASRT